MIILEGKKIKGKISYCFKGECYHSTQSCIKKERENNLHLRRIYHFVGVGRGGSMREEKMHDPHGGCKTYLPLAPALYPPPPHPMPLDPALMGCINSLLPQRTGAREGGMFIPAGRCGLATSLC